jgi:hypothetical protein
MKRPDKIGAIAVAAFIAGMAPMAAIAQTAPAPMEAQDVTGPELDAFAMAYANVVAIDAEYAAQLDLVTDTQERQQLVEEAQIRKAEAVTATDGIDVDRYVEILMLAQADPELTSQIIARLE